MRDTQTDKRLMNRATHWIFALLLVLGTGLVGCVEEKGPFEKAGEKIDEATEEVRDGAEDVADELEDGAEEVGDALDGDGGENPTS